LEHEPDVLQSGDVVGRPLASQSTARPQPTTLVPVAAVFVLIGLFVGAWAVSIPEIERALGGGPGRLGLALTVALGLASVANSWGGALAERRGTSRAMAVTLTIWAVTAAVGALAPAPVGLALAIVVVYTVFGPVDVVANVAATAALADHPGRLVRIHALFNGGGALGAAIAGVLLLALGAWSWRLAWAAAALLGLCLAVWAARSRLPAGAAGDHVGVAEGVRILHREGLIPVALAFGLGAMVEGGITTWGVLQLREQVGAGVLVGALSSVLGYSVAFVARMSVGRVQTRRGARQVLVVGTALAAVGLAALAFAPVTAAAAAGLVLAAGGVSVTWPLLMSDVGRGRPRPGALVGALSSVGYVGLVVGPGLIGVIAGWFGLTVGIALLAAGVAVVPALLALRWRNEGAEEPVSG
jgi:MFS family permease